jgi:hypothetical protein
MGSVFWGVLHPNLFGLNGSISPLWRLFFLSLCPSQI